MSTRRQARLPPIVSSRAGAACRSRRRGTGPAVNRRLSSPAGAGRPGCRAGPPRCGYAQAPDGRGGPVPAASARLAYSETGSGRAFRRRGRPGAARSSAAERASALLCAALAGLPLRLLATAEADLRRAAAAATCAASPDAPRRELAALGRGFRSAPARGSSSMRGMRGVRGGSRSGCGGMKAFGVGIAGPARQAGSMNSDGFSGIGRIGHLFAVRDGMIAAATAACAARSSRRPKPAPRRARLRGLDRLGAARRRSATRGVSEARSSLRHLRKRVRPRLPAAAARQRVSMPVATTETRMMPSRLSSKVAPTMMLAS